MLSASPESIQTLRCRCAAWVLSSIAEGEAAGRVIFRLENRKSALPSGSVPSVRTVVKTLPLSPTVVGQ